MLASAVKTPARRSWHSLRWRQFMIALCITTQTSVNGVGWGVGEGWRGGGEGWGGGGEFVSPDTNVKRKKEPPTPNKNNNTPNSKKQPPTTKTNQQKKKKKRKYIL